MTALIDFFRSDSREPHQNYRFEDNPAVFDLPLRTAQMCSIIQANLPKSHIDNTHMSYQVHHAIKAIDRVQLNSFYAQILSIINCVIQFFHSEFRAIDNLLAADLLCHYLTKKYWQILSPQVATYSALEAIKLSEKPLFSHLIRVGVCELHRYQFVQVYHLLQQFKEKLVDETVSNEELLKSFNKLPKYFREGFVRLVQREFNNNKTLEKDFRILLRSRGVFPSIFDRVIGVVLSQIESYDRLAAIEREHFSTTETEEKQLVMKSIGSTDRLMEQLKRQQGVIDFDDHRYVYDISFERLLAEISSNTLRDPVRVTMVGVEYAGLIKQGGLAEALEGLTQSMKEQNPDNRVNLVFPKYSHLPADVLSELEEAQTCLTDKGEEYKVYQYEKDGVTCYFIEHPSFVLEKNKPNIYGPDYMSQARRFAKFSELATEFIYEHKDEIDVIHLHDWHVSGIGLKLQREHQEEWKEGRIPPVIFTFHNNNKSAQGRVSLSPYSYDPVIEGYRKSGIIDNNENLFVQVLKVSDGVTTVSETFGLEAQSIDGGAGVSFAVRQAAKVNKLTGIINGTNPGRWNPQTDQSLIRWRDIDTNDAVDLSYGPDSTNILEQKQLCKQQLQKWVARYQPHVQIDFSKPLVTYIGRFDSYQKGLDRFEEAIQATLSNGGQFVCMGMGEDERATQILDALEEKYKTGVFFIRDYKNAKGRLFYQHGDETRPGIGSLIRAASEFVFVPSSFEPCGLVQFEGWLFGSLAIGARTGGLVDTIMTQENYPETFNGFLFDREGSYNNSMTRVIQKSMQFWQHTRPEEKQAIVRRLIREGRQYGWSTSPRGYSPVEKYRLVYEKARQEIGYRRSYPETFDRIDALRRRTLLHAHKKTHAEEEYLYHYYLGMMGSEQLEKLYFLAPETVRSQLPAPYGEGVNYNQHMTYGAFCTPSHTRFSVFAPRARQVKVVLVSEDETERREIPMAKNKKGKWAANIRGIKPGQRYQYNIDGRIKVDPYGRMQEFSKNHPDTAPYSVVMASNHSWQDHHWMDRREDMAGKPAPMSVYELHPSTWKRNIDGSEMNYRRLAKDIVRYCKEMGYTHVELMGILEHPFDITWGYLATGYFSPNHRHGTPDDFKYMIDYFHKHNIGVILDWVPGHFAKEEHGLSQFDGAEMYEPKPFSLSYPSGLGYSISRRRIFYNFGGKHFDYRNKQVRDFLISSALFWLNDMHIDGLRVDCVSSMLSSEDKEAATLFLRDFNATVHRHGRGAFTVAEEEIGEKAVTAPVYDRGYNFDIKWHMGWMDGTLKYFSSPLAGRVRLYDQLKETVMCDNFHTQMMYISHDNVKASLGTLINKNSTIVEEALRYANVRSLLSFMMCLPGKKLQFMGSEFANPKPWDALLGTHKGLLDEVDIRTRERQQMRRMVRDLNTMYTKEKAFYEFDSNGHDLKWINDPKKQIHAYRRTSSDGASFVCLHNFTNEDVTEFAVALDKQEDVVIGFSEEFNSDKTKYGGLNRTNTKIFVEEADQIKYTVRVPPLSTIVIREVL